MTALGYANFFGTQRTSSPQPDLGFFWASCFYRVYICSTSSVFVPCGGEVRLFWIGVIQNMIEVTGATLLACHRGLWPGLCLPIEGVPIYLHAFAFF